MSSELGLNRRSSAMIWNNAADQGDRPTQGAGLLGLFSALRGFENALPRGRR